MQVLVMRADSRKGWSIYTREGAESWKACSYTATKRTAKEAMQLARMSFNGLSVFKMDRSRGVANYRAEC